MQSKVGTEHPIVPLRALIGLISPSRNGGWPRLRVSGVAWDVLGSVDVAPAKGSESRCGGSDSHRQQRQQWHEGKVGGGQLWCVLER